MLLRKVRGSLWIVGVGVLLLTPLNPLPFLQHRILSFLHGTKKKEKTLDENLKIENYLLKLELERVNRFSTAKVAHGRIIYRDPLSWSSFVWIDLGKKDQIDHLVKNAPVVVDDILVGVIDRVERTSSKVRLITDPQLHPSVQIHRGSQKLYDVKQTALQLQKQLTYYQELPFTEKERRDWIGGLDGLIQGLDPHHHYERLSMGFLSGVATSFWNSQRPYLKGAGFAYRNDSGTFFLVHVGDLLVTSGLDGVFPPGLKVAYVTKVYPQQEGDYVAHIEGEPLIYLDKAKVVTVIPPMVEEKEKDRS